METLRCDQTQQVLTITLDRPAVFNAYNLAMATELRQVIEQTATDPAIRAVVITGAGRAFCAGLDLKALDQLVVPGERPKFGDFLRATLNPLTRALAALDKPVIAAVNGVAAGAGLSLALACDLRIADAGASFVSAFIRVGLAPDAGLLYFLPRLVGPAEALRLAWTGEAIGAEEAQRLGLVNQVVPAGTALAAAQALARQLAQGPAHAIALTKQGFQRAAGKSLAETLEIEAELQQILGQEDDFQEGVAAFLEKRAPRFVSSPATPEKG
jgi:2-(1,2-epoxy-1,2-dihydrophenyl)acetyl-CoA isomerase